MRNVTNNNREQEAGFRLDLGHYFRIFWRKKYFLLVPLAIAFIVASIGVRFLVPEYECSTLIKIGNPNTSASVDRFMDVRRGHDQKTLVQLKADILGSNFLNELIRKLGLDHDPDVIARAELSHQRYPALSTEELVFRRLRDFLKRKIKVEAEGPELFRVSYADANPDACYVIGTAIADLYVDMQREQTMKTLRTVSDFSEEQLVMAKDRLDRSERELADFQEKLASRGVATANPVSERNVALSEKVRSDLDLTVRASESTLQKIRGRITEALGSMPSSNPISRDPETAKLSNELANRREAELLVELSGEGSSRTSPELDPVLATQQALQRRLQQIVLSAYPNVPTDYRPLLVEYFYQQAEERAYRRKLTKLDAYISQFRNQVALQPQMETELSRLRNEVERNRSLYNTFKDAKSQAEIGGDVAQNPALGSMVSLVEAAVKPVSPARPDKLKITFLCFLFGATVGAAGLLLTEFTDSSYRNVEEVERQLGLRVLGTIPRVGNTRWVSESSRRRTVIWVAVCVTFVCVFISAFYFYGKSSREHLIDLNPSVSSNSEVQSR